MKVFPNIVPILQLLGSAGIIGAHKKEIERAHREKNDAKEAEAIMKASKDWGKYLVEKYRINVVIKNEEKMPKEGGVVYVANHQSYIDVVTLYSILNTQVGFIAKSEFGKVPGLGKWIKRLRGILITRGNPRESVKTVYRAVDYIKSGYSIAVFPEGTRSKSDNIGVFKPGSFKFATKARAPIVPVTIDGAYKVYEGTGILHRGETVTITFHDRIETKNLTREEILALPKKVEDIVKSGME